MALSRRLFPRASCRENPSFAVTPRISATAEITKVGSITEARTSGSCSPSIIAVSIARAAAAGHAARLQLWAGTGYRQAEARPASMVIEVLQL
jgi:hypothetical protein